MPFRSRARRWSKAARGVKRKRSAISLTVGGAPCLSVNPRMKLSTSRCRCVISLTDTPSSFRSAKFRSTRLREARIIPREDPTQHHNSQHPLSWPSKKNQAGSHGSQEGQGWRDASLASATRLKYTRSGSLIRRTQPHSRVWNSLAPRWATKASPGGTSAATLSEGGARGSVDSPSAGAAAGLVATSRGAGAGAEMGGESISSIWRLVLIVDSNSALALLNSRMARPSDRPSWGRFFGPKTRRAITKMRMSSWRPMSNMTEPDDITPTHGEARASRIVTGMTLHEFPARLVFDAALPIAIVSTSDRTPRARPPHRPHVDALSLARATSLSQVNHPPSNIDAHGPLDLLRYGARRLAHIASRRRADDAGRHRHHA